MTERIFKDEAEMQKWLSNEFKENDDSLLELIINYEELQDMFSTEMAEKKVIDSFKICLESLETSEVIIENENISLSPNDILKPDFVLYAPATESIIIIELKNIVQPSRQVGTEVSAYANEIKTYIPFISDGDIVNIIISPVWSTLLCHYVFHEIFWQQRNILCLEPITYEGSIKLKIVDHKLFASEKISLKLSEEHIGGYQICLYDDNLYKEPNNRTRLDPYLVQMKTALAAMSSKGNSQRNHGFAFLWKDHWELSLAPYSITLLNFAPFKSFERHYHNEEFEPNEICSRFTNLIKNYDPMGHSNSLYEISKHGKSFLENFCSPQAEGFLSWGILRNSMLARGELISFNSWGVFEELYSDKLLLNYKAGFNHIPHDDPDLALELIKDLIDPEYTYYDLTGEDEDQIEDDDFPF